MVNKLTKKKKKKKKGGTNIPNMPYGDIDGELDPLLNRMDCKARAQWCMANKGYCNDEIYDMYIKPCKNKATVFKENTEHILSNLNCKSRAQWCSVNKARRTQCLDRNIQSKYIKPCKMVAENNRTIKEISTQNTDSYKYNSLFDFYFDEVMRGSVYINYSLENYLREVLWWLSKDYPIKDDFPWDEVIPAIIYSFDDTFSHLPWFYIEMDLYEFIDIFSEDGRILSANIIERYFKRTRNTFIDVVDQEDLPMDNIRCYRVFQRLLNALLIGNPTTTEFARYKMDLGGFSDSDDSDSDSDDLLWEPGASQPEPEPDASQWEEFLEVD
jgi:hypothetical protein